MAGVQKKKIDIRDYVFKNEDIVIPSQYIAGAPTIIKDQGNVWSCVGHATSSLMEMESSIKDTLSPGYIYGKRYSNKDKGMQLRDAMKTLSKTGICRWKDFPYNQEVPQIFETMDKHNFSGAKFYKSNGYFSISPTTYSLKNAIYLTGPILISVKWFEDTITTPDGLLHSSKKGKYNLHCVLVYGYTPKGFLIQNSWGDTWGNKGCGIVPYDFPIAEAWGVYNSKEEYEKYNISNLTDNNFLGNICKIFNFVINLFIKKK